MLFGYFQVC